jgi:hypothetical protein
MLGTRPSNRIVYRKRNDCCSVSVFSIPVDDPENDNLQVYMTYLYDDSGEKVMRAIGDSQTQAQDIANRWYREYTISDRRRMGKDTGILEPTMRTKVDSPANENHSFHADENGFLCEACGTRFQFDSPRLTEFFRERCRANQKSDPFYPTGTDW